MRYLQYWWFATLELRQRRCGVFMNEPDNEKPAIDPAVIEHLQEVVSQLRESVSKLDDVAMDVLRSAYSRREGRPAIDKTITQARRAIEKAIHLIDIDGHS